MAQRIRRGRGESADTVGVYVEVAPAVKATFDGWSTKSAAPKWAVFEAMVHHLEEELQSSSDLPSWWPANHAEQEELPLKAS